MGKCAPDHSGAASLLLLLLASNQWAKMTANWQFYSNVVGIVYEIRGSAPIDKVYRDPKKNVCSVLRTYTLQTLRTFSW